MPPTSSSSSSPPSSHHHCYLLQSKSNPSKTYIGYTTNPHRRIQQHNGLLKGGANQTKQHRPWDMKLVIGGFDNDTDGLKFEWAWQNPNKSLIFRSGFDCLDDDDDNNNDNKYDDNNNTSSTISRTINKGSQKALINLLLKSCCGKNKALQKQLTILMILLCQSKYYKTLPLAIYFLSHDTNLHFHDLFWNKNNKWKKYVVHYDDYEEEDDGFGNFCRKLPSQMKCQTISSFQVMPFYIALEQHHKKSKESKSCHKKRPLVSLLKDTTNYSNIDNEEQCNHIVNNLHNLSLSHDDDDDIDVMFLSNKDKNIISSTSTIAKNDKNGFELLDCSSSGSSRNSNDSFVWSSGHDNYLLLPPTTTTEKSTRKKSEIDQSISISTSSDDETIDLIDYHDNNHMDDHHNLDDDMVPNVQTHKDNCDYIRSMCSNDIIDLTSPCKHRNSHNGEKFVDSNSDSDCTIDLCSP